MANGTRERTRETPAMSSAGPGRPGATVRRQVGPGAAGAASAPVAGAGTWVLVADAAQARLLGTSAGERGFQPVGRHDAPAPQDTGAPETERLAREVADDLEAARRAARYERLYVVAPPRMLGTLRRFYGAQTQRALREEINRDLSMLEGQALARLLERLIPR